MSSSSSSSLLLFYLQKIKTEKSRFYCSIQLGFNSVRDGNEIGHQSSLKSLTFNWSMARYALRNSFQSQSTLIAIEFDDLDEKTF